MGLDVHDALNGAYEAHGDGNERGVADVSAEGDDAFVDVHVDGVAEGWEEVGHHGAADLLLDILVRPQEDLQQIGTADDALEHADVVDHGQTLDVADGHDP